MFLYFDILRKLLKVHLKKYAQNYDEKVIYSETFFEVRWSSKLFAIVFSSPETLSSVVGYYWTTAYREQASYVSKLVGQSVITFSLKWPIGFFEMTVS